MADVYEGAPDGRQASDPAVTGGRFRMRYRQLSAEELELHDAIKSAYADVEELLERLPGSRYRALALTELEASCMWGIKALTAPPGTN